MTKAMIQRKMIRMVGCMLFAVAILGCSHYVKPKNPEPVNMTDAGMYSSPMSVWLVNTQMDSYKTQIGAMGGHTYYAKNSEWTQFMVDQWKEELLKRGVHLSDDSQNRIMVKLSSLNISFGMFVNNAYMDLSLSTPDRTWSWRNSYEGGCSTFNKQYCAFSNLIHNAIKDMLTNDEIIARMRTE